MAVRFELTTPETLTQGQEFATTTDEDMVYTRVESVQILPGFPRATVDLLYQTDKDTDQLRENIVLEGTDYDDLMVASVDPADTAEALTVLTATAGTATTVTHGPSSWTVDAKIGYVIEITAGTNSGKKRIITDNDATSLTFDTMTTACDNTSQFTVRPSVIGLLHRALLIGAMAYKSLPGGPVEV